jgi:arsenite-transporting ATPase
LRTVLFTGKGGAGKTTAAAATAVHSARSGVKTLVVSTDAAHSLGDALALPLGAQPREVETGLYAQHVDTRSRARSSWSGVRGYLLSLLDQVGVDHLEAEELTDLPGAEEVLALLEVRDAVEHGGWDLVVVDCAPTAETLRLLALPEVLRRCLDRMLPMERRVARVLSPGFGSLLGSLGGSPPPRDHVVEAVQRLQDELASVRSVLTAEGTSTRLVVTPESVAVAESLRAWTSLSLFGYLVDGVVVNRVFPEADADPWRAGWVAAHRERLAELSGAFGELPITRVPYTAAEPVGLPALADLALQVYGEPGSDWARTVTAVPTGTRPMRVRRQDEGFVLEIDLPLARREETDLTRHGDELVVSSGGRRRVVALPGALRRCEVGGARLREGVLAVSFTPDPAQWRSG